MREISQVAQTVTLSPIREMFDRAQGMTDVISFTLGEPDFPTPPHIVEAAVDALRSGAHRYTANAGILPLRQAICRATQRSHGLNYDPETQAIVTSGGTEALVLTMLTILNPGDEFIVTDPCWTNYPSQIQICSAIPKCVPVGAESNFQLTAEALEAAITPRTKGFVINSPANPTGGVAGRKALEDLARVAIEHDLYVISDEVYARLLYDGEEAVSIATLPGMQERTIIVDSFSKSYAMTGWRIGYALGPEELIKNMVKLQEDVMACVNASAQYAAIAALEGTQEPFYEMLSAYKRRRELVLKEIATVKNITCFAPQGAFYALLDIAQTGMTAREFALDLLDKARVIIVPGEAFGQTSNRYLRLSFATSEDTIREGIARIRTYMTNRA